MLFCLNACKDESSTAKTNTKNGSSSPAVNLPSDSLAVAKDDIVSAQPEMEKTQSDAKILNKKSSGNWPTIAQNFFLNQCIKDGNFLSQDQAKNYCNCMLVKIQDKYPNLKEAGKMTREEAHTLSQSCLK